MLRFFVSSLILWSVVPGVSGAQLNQLTPEEKAAGWELLFNGKDMDGWDDPRRMTPPGDAWTVEDGWLKAHANPRITEDLFTRGVFGDFELTFEWRISKSGNSGVKYRIQDHLFLLDRPSMKFEDLVNLTLQRRRTDRPARGQDYVIGFEYQVIDDDSHYDAKAGLIRMSGAVYDMVPAARRVSRKAGEVNQSRLVVKGSQVEHWLNGVKVVDTDLKSQQIVDGVLKRWGKGTPVYDLLAGQPKKECPISLQNHGDEAWFRSIKIRKLR